MLRYRLQSIAARRMTGFLENAKDAVKGAYCQYLQNVDDYAKFLANRTSKIPFTGQFNDAMSRLVGAANAGLCPVPPAPATIAPDNNTPGQCVGVAYDVFVKARCFMDNFQGSFGDFFYEANYRSNSAVPLTGPIGNVVVPGAVVGGQLNNSGPPCRINYGDNQQIALQFVSKTRPNETNTGSNRVVEVLETTIVRRDGMPDDCGPTTKPDSPESERTFPVIINNNEGDEITNNYGGNVVFAFPIINIKGEITIPFSLDGAEFNLIGELNLDGNIEFNIGSEKPDKRLPGDEPTDTDTPPPDEGEETPEGEGRTIIAVVVSVKSITTSIGITEIGQIDGPTIYAPNLGYVHFVMKAGEGTHWSSDIPVKNRNTYIPAPGNNGSVGVYGTPRPGVQWSLTPVYVKIPLKTESEG
jgi:hypothetical protein